MPSWPEIQVATEGMSRVLVHVHTITAATSSGPMPACAMAASEACRAISSNVPVVYSRWSMPVLALISSAAIGDQL
jgi:hypothetical protein